MPEPEVVNLGISFSHGALLDFLHTLHQKKKYFFLSVRISIFVYIYIQNGTLKTTCSASIQTTVFLVKNERQV